ncbi:MAG: hypothetical protein DRO09_02290, partial [Thermoprotei archaeon]
MNSSGVVIYYCDIYGNREHGLYVEGDYIVNATYNWWGSPDGPEYKEEGDPEDPEEVYSESGSEYLIYEPWLTEPIIDDIPPSVEILSPEEQSYVRGIITVIVNAYDNETGVEKVEFYLNGTLVFTDYDYPYEYAWNTTGYPDETYKIKVIAYDEASNTAEHEIMVIVDNTAPTGSINNPANNTYVRRIVIINVTGEDRNLKEIKLYANSTLLASWNTSGTHTYDWDTTRLTDGYYEIKLLVKDRAGNVYSTHIIVTVDNTAPTIGEPTISPESPVEGSNVTIRVNVTDTLSGVAEVILSYSTDGGLTWTNATMTAAS